MTHWITQSNDSFKNTDLDQQKWLPKSNSLNYLFNRFIQKHEFIQEQ